MSEGLLVTVEGLDGVGKTTAARGIAEGLGEEVLSLREPGGSSLGELVRDVLKGRTITAGDPEISPLAGNLLEELASETSNESLADLLVSLASGEDVSTRRVAGEISARDELFLFNAARAELVAEVIAPALLEGRLVLLDRFSDSTIAYQGYGRGLDVSEVSKMCERASAGMKPDLTLLLVVSAAERERRLSGRGEGSDPIEEAGKEFFARVARGFEEIAAREPDRFSIINAEQEPAAAVRECVEIVSARREPN